jgi:polyphenol oxidase
MPGDWLGPHWPDVGAVMTTRADGESRGPWQGFNLGSHVGDDPAHVAANRERFAERLGATPMFMNQIHGQHVVRLSAADRSSSVIHDADAAFTTEPGIACTVMVADCLPLLMAAPEGRGVAAAHAGWRGLAHGVVDAAALALCEAAACDPQDLRVWLGACIGPDRFEVGADVLRAFDAPPGDPLFKASAPAGQAPKWLADLAGLARRRLARLGARQVEGGAWCTVSDSSRFFSFRRDGVTGRMAAAVWLRG